MEPRQAYAITRYRMPLRRRVGRFITALWRWLTAPRCEL